MAFVLINLFMLLFIFVSNSQTWVTHGEPQVPCFFIFGDSILDPGTEGYKGLPPLVFGAKYPPYGIDFPGGNVTGRFSNGRTVPDVVAQLLGFKDPIPRLEYGSRLAFKDSPQGVNYALGTSGILPETGRSGTYETDCGGNICNMGSQDREYVTMLTRSSINGRPLENTTFFSTLNKCIFMVGVGTYDYISDFLLPSSLSHIRTSEEYAEHIIEHYFLFLQDLYDRGGARKVAVIGLGQLGFTPTELGMHNKTGSPPSPSEINELIDLFNSKLKESVDRFNRDKVRFPNATLTFINTTAILTTPTPRSPALKVLTSPCCTLAENNLTCKPNTTPCTNRDEYLFFDGIHHTEAVNVYLANEIYNSSFPAFAQPYDLATLARL